MIILALDTASPVCAACVSREGKVLAQATEIIGAGHAERLMPMVQEIMALANISYQDIDQIAVSVGPGSFTGVRTGVAAAKGFAQALNIPLIGISTLEAIAFEANKANANTALRVVIDAKRGEVHTQDFNKQGTADGVPVLLSLDDAKGGLGSRTLAGNGAALVDETVPSLLPLASTASICIFAEIAATRAGNDNTSLTIMPLYLRSADAKPQSGFALARTD
ncbi:MAG: tRNA (adenosine(37)-N6)-threonylcarbamoyltransferase complex dimerization subunit type 1 TsaB [Notoacmeibacter sp.]